MMNGYQAYIKDNPNGYWFKARLYGWGWTPVRWQGWVTLLVFLVLIVCNAFRLTDELEADNWIAVEFILETVTLVTVLIAICFKTGERPRWNWGLPDRYKDTS